MRPLIIAILVVVVLNLLGYAVINFLNTKNQFSASDAPKSEARTTLLVELLIIFIINSIFWMVSVLTDLRVDGLALSAPAWVSLLKMALGNVAPSDYQIPVIFGTIVIFLFSLYYVFKYSEESNFSFWRTLSAWAAQSIVVYLGINYLVYQPLAKHLAS